jgi:hypothetical protein
MDDTELRIVVRRRAAGAIQVLCSGLQAAGIDRSERVVQTRARHSIASRRSK